MTEQQIETLEKVFPGGGAIVFKEPNGSWCVCSFGVLDENPAMEELADELAGVHSDTSLLVEILNKHFPPEPKGL